MGKPNSAILAVVSRVLQLVLCQVPGLSPLDTAGNRFCCTGSVHEPACCQEGFEPACRRNFSPMAQSVELPRVPGTREEHMAIIKHYRRIETEAGRAGENLSCRRPRPTRRACPAPHGATIASHQPPPAAHQALSHLQSMIQQFPGAPRNFQLLNWCCLLRPHRCSLLSRAA